ncbi:MAG TPA: AAA family ATPase [Christensenellaceae bacterium]|nr:AAA family ATPase [Christensenellaceae bacterium]
MNKREKILNEVITYYLGSSEFNGLPIYTMKNYDYEILSELINNQYILVLSEREVNNPHIKAFNYNIPIEKQKSNISELRLHSVLYPTPKALDTISPDLSKPYTALLQKGEAQFKIVFFNIEILERYANNPQFKIIDFGYRGSILPNDELYDDETLEYEYIKDYGMAYIDQPELERAIGVFVCDLSKLSSQKQMLWKGFEINDNVKCKVHKHFYDNLICGEWVADYWIFHALIEEMKIINEQCEKMGIPKLFNKTFDNDPYNTPDGYRNIFLPTLKNYYDFVLVLEKMVIHNISYNAFQKNSYLISAVKRKDESGNDKGSLQMLEEWLMKNIRTQENLRNLIIEPLRYIRSLRQKPAHELSSNVYDVSLYQKQHDLIEDTYSAIRAIRLLFSNHPNAKEVCIPKYLKSGTNIVNY